MEEDYYDFLYKIILIGDINVGKTNIISKYIYNKFYKNTKAVGVGFGSKIFKIEGYICKLQIWDTAGQERYKTINGAFYRGSKCAFMVYDITQKSTFDNIDEWIKQLKSETDGNVTIVILGNKCDLEKERQITKEQGESKAKKI